MRKLIILVLAGFLLTTCKKASESPYWGFASATLNGRPWRTEAVKCYIDPYCFRGKLSFKFIVLNEQGFESESISLLAIPKSIGSFKIHPSITGTVNECKDTVALGGYFTLQGLGDVLKDVYNSSSDGKSVVTITELNNQSGIIRGTFNITFVNVYKKDPKTPDTLKFTNGEFYTKIQGY